MSSNILLLGATGKFTRQGKALPLIVTNNPKVLVV